MKPELVQPVEAAVGSAVEAALAAAVLTHGPDAVIATDTDSRIAYFNRRAEELFGYAAADVIGQPIELLVPPALRVGHVPLRIDYTADPVVRPMGDARIVSGVRKDGSEVAVTIALAPFASPSGRWVMCVVRDATQLQKAQARQAQQDKMEAVGRLAGGIAHDINNHLTVIQGYAQILGSDGGLGVKSREHLVEIERASQRSARMLQQILSFSRKQILVPCPVDPNALCGGIVEMLRRLVGDAINLAFVPCRGLGPIHVDPSQLETALVNLVLNAKDAMPSGGHIAIETAAVHLGGGGPNVSDIKAGEYVMLSVTDTGCGMDEATLARICEPFFTTKDVGKGTGLGLASVYGFVKQSGGYLHVHSEPNCGTIFKLFFPPYPESADASPRAAPALSSPIGTETLLVVEDDDGVRDVVVAILRHHGYRVLSAHSGKAAHDLVKRSSAQIDLLITDVMMPGSTGPATAERLTALRPGLKVLYTSGFAADDVIDLAWLGRSADFLQKPMSAAALTGKVREILDRGVAPSPAAGEVRACGVPPSPSTPAESTWSGAP